MPELHLKTCFWGFKVMVDLRNFSCNGCLPDYRLQSCSNTSETEDGWEQHHNIQMQLEDFVSSYTDRCEMGERKSRNYNVFIGCLRSPCTLIGERTLHVAFFLVVVVVVTVLVAPHLRDDYNSESWIFS